MTSTFRASLALALAATLTVGAAQAQAPAQAPAKAGTPTAPATSAPAIAKTGDDILETAAKAGNFKTLARLLDTADLTKVLKGKGPFTVFAPTDDAFAKLTKEQTEALTTPKFKRLLVSMLGAHVIPGKVLKSDRITAAKAFHVKMYNGSLVAVDGKDAKAVKFGTATVTKADIEAANGVVHVIDTVYLPKRVRAALFAIDKAEKARAAAGPALQKAKELGGKAVDATKDAAGKAVDKAKEAVGSKPATPAPATK